MNRILVAVSPSDSMAVVNRAIALARKTEGKLRLLRAVPLPSNFPPSIGSLTAKAETIARLVAWAEQSLQSVLEAVPKEFRDGMVVEVGTPEHVICDAAKTYEADVVVIGAHEHGRLARALGTTATRVVNQIDRAVFVVRDTSFAAKGERHAFLDAVGVAGAVTGAVTGALLGPPGIVVGGVLGATAGLFAGNILDENAARASAHDRKLDADIGVTDGNISARDSSVPAATKLEEAKRSGTEVAGATPRTSDFLRADSAHLETVYSAFLFAYRRGDWADVQAQWQVFEGALRAHMVAEEAKVLPVFHQTDPEEAVALFDDHRALRMLLDEVGVGVQLQSISLPTAIRLVGRLRAHSAREEMLLYPWLDGANAAKVPRTASAS